ncbi:conserved hypothetical protein [Neospora caninum Liverpool]|uniref:Uncharacterized protein n=1 Tax=Neospora caninum (strain Liverpool) TaxID=572307 RepID=F0V8Z4_NEOCL|nr:conserved hypothetical protein [Neospora caninum Liverpool]CBZ50185.1 conserved hypothetical protein [Neospora caninum Liverpool]CEL64786.1 TPA: hypothetical protein BN1204_006600 [Neospora caninum Liverpool]|eukprot:XP_003880220.1 conserved hypothetical protein [Neospora caninum Liverpool]
MADPPLHLSSGCGEPPLVRPAADAGEAASLPSLQKPAAAQPSGKATAARLFQNTPSPLVGLPLGLGNPSEAAGVNLSYLQQAAQGPAASLSGAPRRSDLSFAAPSRVKQGSVESKENTGPAHAESRLPPGARVGGADAQAGLRLASQNARSQALEPGALFRTPHTPGTPLHNGLQLMPPQSLHERSAGADSADAAGTITSASTASLPNRGLAAGSAPYAPGGGAHAAGAAAQEGPHTSKQFPPANRLSSPSPLPEASSLTTLPTGKLLVPSSGDSTGVPAAPPLARFPTGHPRLGNGHSPEGQGRTDRPLPLQPPASSPALGASAPNRLTHAHSTNSGTLLNARPAAAVTPVSGASGALDLLAVFSAGSSGNACVAGGQQLGSLRVPVHAGPLSVSALSATNALPSGASLSLAASSAQSRVAPRVCSDAAKQEPPVSAPVVNSPSAGAPARDSSQEHSLDSGDQVPGVSPLPSRCLSSPFAAAKARPLPAAGSPGGPTPSTLLSPSSAVVAAKRKVLPSGGQATPPLPNCVAGAGPPAPKASGPARCPVGTSSGVASALSSPASAGGAETPRGSQGPRRLPGGLNAALATRKDAPGTPGHPVGLARVHAPHGPSQAVKVLSRSECSSPHVLLSSTPSPPGSPSLRLQRSGIPAAKARQRSTSVGGGTQSSAAVLAAAASRLAHLSGKASSPTAVSGLGPTRLPSSPTSVAGLGSLLSPGAGSPLAVGGSPLFGRGLGAQPTDAASRAAAVVAAAAAAAAAGYSSLAAATSSGLSSCAVLKASSTRPGNAPSPRARGHPPADSPSSGAAGARRPAPAGKAGPTIPGRSSASPDTRRESLGGDGASKPGPNAAAGREETKSTPKEKESEGDTSAGRRVSSGGGNSPPRQSGKPGDEAQASEKTASDRLQILASLFPRSETTLDSSCKSPRSGSVSSAVGTSPEGSAAHAPGPPASEDSEDAYLRAFWKHELGISKVPRFLDDNPRGEGWFVVASALPACVSRQELLREKVRAHLAPQLEAAMGQTQAPPRGFRETILGAMNPLCAGRLDRPRTDREGRRVSGASSPSHTLPSDALSSRPPSPARDGASANGRGSLRQLPAEERSERDSSKRPGDEGPGETGAEGRSEADGSGEEPTPPFKKRRTEEDFFSAGANTGVTPPDDLLHVLPRLSSAERRRMRQMERPSLSKAQREKVTQHLCASARNLFQCVQEMQMLGALPRAIAAAPEAPPNGLTDSRSAALEELRKAMLDLPPSALCTGLHAPESFPSSSSSLRHASRLSSAPSCGRDKGDSGDERAGSAEEDDSERRDIFFHLGKDSPAGSASGPLSRGLPGQDSAAPPGGTGSAGPAFPSRRSGQEPSGPEVASSSLSAVSDSLPEAPAEGPLAASSSTLDVFLLADEDMDVWSEEEGEACADAFPFGPADPYSVLYSAPHDASPSRPPWADLANAFSAFASVSLPSRVPGDGACSSISHQGGSFPSFSVPRTLHQAFQEERAALPWRVPPDLNEEESAAWLRGAIRDQKVRETEFRNFRLFQLERKALGVPGVPFLGPSRGRGGETPATGDSRGLRLLSLTEEEEEELRWLREERRRQWEKAESSKRLLRPVLCAKDLKDQKRAQTRLRKLSEKLADRERRRSEDVRRLRELREAEIKRCEERKIHAAQEEKERDAMQAEDDRAREREGCARREREGTTEEKGGELRDVHRSEETGVPGCVAQKRTACSREESTLPGGSGEHAGWTIPTPGPLPSAGFPSPQRSAEEASPSGAPAESVSVAKRPGLGEPGHGPSSTGLAVTPDTPQKPVEEVASPLSRGNATGEVNGESQVPGAAPGAKEMPRLNVSRSVSGLQPAKGEAAATGGESLFSVASAEAATRDGAGDGENGDDKTLRRLAAPLGSDGSLRPGDEKDAPRPVAHAGCGTSDSDRLACAERLASSAGEGGPPAFTPPVPGEVASGGMQTGDAEDARVYRGREGKENEMKAACGPPRAQPPSGALGGDQPGLRPRLEGGEGEGQLNARREGGQGGTVQECAADKRVHVESQVPSGVHVLHALQEGPESAKCQPVQHQLQQRQLQQLLQFQQTPRPAALAAGAEGTHALAPAVANARYREGSPPPQVSQARERQRATVQLPAQGMQQPHLQALLERKQQLLRQQILQNVLAQQQQQPRPR